MPPSREVGMSRNCATPTRSFNTAYPRLAPSWRSTSTHGAVWPDLSALGTQRSWTIFHSAAGSAAKPHTAESTTSVAAATSSDADRATNARWLNRVITTLLSPAEPLADESRRFYPRRIVAHRTG